MDLDEGSARDLSGENWLEISTSSSALSFAFSSFVVLVASSMSPVKKIFSVRRRLSSIIECYVIIFIDFSERKLILMTDDILVQSHVILHSYYMT